MVIELKPTEIEILKELIKKELKETTKLINSYSSTDKDKLSNYYNQLYMINQKLT